MRFLRETLAIARLDFGEVRRSKWLFFVMALYATLALVLMIAAARESALFGLEGMHRVIFSLAHVLLVAIPLLALMATVQVVNRARDDGTIELLFSHPLGPSAYLSGIGVVRLLAISAPLFVVLLALAIGAQLFLREAAPWSITLRALLCTLSLVWAFVGTGLAISTLTRNTARATVIGLLCWSAGVVFLDLALVGLLLQWRLPAQTVFVLAALNPVEASRLALISGIEPDLATLGPVGFYLTNRLGNSIVVAFGILWPLIFGTLMWLWAWRHFRRHDLT